MAVMFLATLPPAWAGYYSSIDMPEETRYSLDFGMYFSRTF